MRPWDPDLYRRALLFAAKAHAGQNIPGTTTPYLAHLTLVCHEALGALVADPALDAALIVQCALLHDTLEDTAVTFDV